WGLHCFQTCAAMGYTQAAGYGERPLDCWRDVVTKNREVIGREIGQPLETAKRVFEKIGEFMCETIAKPICDIVKIVQAVGDFVQRLGRYKNIGKVLMSYWDEFKEK